MFNDDDFFLDDNELAEENQPTLVDSARLSLLDSFEKTISAMRESIKFNETSEVSNNLSIMSTYMDHLIKLSNIDVVGLSDEEVYEAIDAVMKSTTELTFSNMNELLPEEAETENVMDDSDNGESTDW